MMKRTALLSFALLSLPIGAIGEDSESDLRRRVMLGAHLEPGSDQPGVKLGKILADSSAEAAGFRSGDFIESIDGNDVPDNISFLATLAEKRVGDEVVVRFLRDGKTLEVPVVLKEKPREKGNGYDVIYGSVTNGDFRQRTIVTRPEGDGPFPAVLFLQGGQTCFPVDDPFGNPSAFIRIAQHLARNGTVTMRVERPGCGDSEGGPLSLVDFKTELSGNLQALRKLKRLDFVDENRVAIYGFSMGGIMAPLIAKEEPVRGIAAYGTTCINWTEGVIAQRRRLFQLRGMSPAEINAVITGHIQFWTQLTVEKKTIREMADSGTIPEPVMKLSVGEDSSVSGRPASFYQQIAGINLAAAWEEVAATPDCPRVLTIKGEWDWHVTDAESTDWIIDSVNGVQPGRAESIFIPGCDHFSNRVDSAEESYHVLYGDRKRKAEFDPAILEILRKWVDETLARQPD